MRLLSGRRHVPVPVSMKLSTTETMSLRMNDTISCDLLTTLLAKSVVAILSVLIAPEFNQL
jgi:hypothetical protein